MSTPKNNLLWPEDHNDSQAVTQAKWDDYIRRTSSPSALAALGLQAVEAVADAPTEEVKPVIRRGVVS